MQLIEIIEPRFQAELREFLVQAKKQIGIHRSSEDHMQHHRGKWSYEEKWTGREAQFGEQTVNHKGTPVWKMSYHGRIRPEFLPPEYTKEASNALVKRCLNYISHILMHVESKRPFRGPEEEIVQHLRMPACYSDLHYVARTETAEHCSCGLSTADIKHFCGHEFVILEHDHKSSTLWECGFNGGLVGSVK